MLPSIKLEHCDTAPFIQQLGEAYRTGKDLGSPDITEEAARGCSEYYTRLARQVEQLAQSLAEKAFEAGRAARPIDTRQ